MSHLSAIGLEMTMKEFEVLAALAAAKAYTYETPLGGYHRWSPGAGVELWLQSNGRGEVVGCNPHFLGEARMEAAIIETQASKSRPMDGRCFGWAAPQIEGNPYSGLHALAVTMPNFACVEERLLTMSAATLQIAAFADRVEIYPTVAAFSASRSAGRSDVGGGRSVWIYEEEEGLPQPEAFLSGTVLKSERRVNPTTEQEFYWMLLQTDAGTVDMVCDTNAVPRRPVVGTTVAAQCWLSALVLTPLPEPPREPTFRRQRRTR